MDTYAVFAWGPGQMGNSARRPTCNAHLLTVGCSGFSGTPRQIGHPPTAPTDAPLGCPAMAFYFKGSGVYVQLGGNVLVHLGGNVPHGRRAPNTTVLALRGMTGFCLCCGVATYVAAPALPKWCEYSEEEATGLASWHQYEPWAVRSYASALFARTYATLSNC